MWRHARRVIGLAVGLAAPSLIVLLVLVFLHLLEPLPGLIAAASILVLIGLIIGPFATALSALRDAFLALEANALVPIEQLRRIPPGANPAGALWNSLIRQTRIWRERIIAAEARLAAAEKIIAAAPDPLILIDRDRRVVRINAAAAALVRALSEPRALAASFRHPPPLAAAQPGMRRPAAPP